MIRLVALLTLGLLSCKGAKPASVEQAPVAQAGQETKWVDPARLVPAPIRPGELTAPQVERIKKLQLTFAEVDPTTLDGWLNDFRRDEDPEREIRIYEGMAEAFSAFCDRRPNLSAAARADVYQLVLSRSGAPDAEVLSKVELKAISADDAKEVLKGYRVPPQPILVGPTP